MYKILVSPLDEIKRFKKEKSLGKSFLYLLFALVIGLVAGLVFSVKLPFGFSKELVVLLACLVCVFLLALFKAVLYKTVFWVLKGKHNFFASLAPVSFCGFVWSVGVLLAVLLSFIPKLGLLLAGLVLCLTLVFAVSVKVKAVMELFEVDLLTSLFACWLVFTVFFVMAYLVIAVSMYLFNAGLLSGMMPGMMGAY